MRTVFVSTPGPREGRYYKELYERSIAPIDLREKLVPDVYWHIPVTGAEGFTAEIRKKIAYSNLVIAVVDGNAPNVMIEVGMALGCGKPVIPLTDATSSLPSLIKHLDAVKYDPTNPDYERIRADLQVRCDHVLFSAYLPLRHRSFEWIFAESRDVGATAEAGDQDLLSTILDDYESGRFRQIVERLCRSSAICRPAFCFC